MLLLLADGPLQLPLDPSDLPEILLTTGTPLLVQLQLLQMKVMATIALWTVGTKPTGLGVGATDQRQNRFEDATLLAALLLLQLLLRQALRGLTIAHRLGHLLEQAHVPGEASVVDVEHDSLAVNAQRVEQQQQDDNHK